MAATLEQAEATERPRGGTVRAAFAALRPEQWTKNALVLAALVFAVRLGEPVRVVDGLVAFAAYCGASSAAYLVNDTLDAERDRLHPVKRHRPVASGALAPRRALALAAVLAVASLVAASRSARRRRSCSPPSWRCRRPTRSGSSTWRSSTCW